MKRRVNQIIKYMMIMIIIISATVFLVGMYDLHQYIQNGNIAMLYTNTMILLCGTATVGLITAYTGNYLVKKEFRKYDALYGNEIVEEVK
jgi:magnesium-transporting ATPase (P-type)